MKQYKLMQADVFAKKPLEGNPCAVLFDADDISEADMLAIAREMNLSETVFIKSSESCDFRPRYFTPIEEIPLAGHPTIATVHCLIEAGLIDISILPKSISLELTAGKIRVDIEPSKTGPYRIVMHQLKPAFLRCYDAQDVFPLFNIDLKYCFAGAPIQTVSTGTPMLMIPVSDIQALKNAQMNASDYIAFKAKGDFFSPHLFCLQGINSEGQTFARHFGTPGDTAEDPFTGSASGSMAAFLWHYGLIDQPRIVAQQGHWMHRPGQAELEVLGPRDDIQLVKLFGTAITVMEGYLKL